MGRLVAFLFQLPSNKAKKMQVRCRFARARFDFANRENFGILLWLARLPSVDAFLMET